MFQLADAAVNPRRTVASILASLVPEPVVHGINKVVDLENKIPGAHYLTTKLPEGIPNPVAQAYQAVAPGGWQAAGNVAPIAGQAIAGEALPVAFPEIAGDVKSAGEGLARIMTDTRNGPVERLVKDAQADNKTIAGVNADRIARQQSDQAKADTDYRGELLKLRQKYDQSVRDATEKARTGTADDRAQYESKQLLAKQKYDQDVRDAQAKRAENLAAAQKAQEFNTGTENTLTLRRQHEQALQQQTADYYAKEEAADARAKAEENTSWSAWRQKITGKTLDGGQITGPLQKLRLDSPEVDRTLNQLEPKGDEVPQESPYAQIRERTAQQHYGKDYQSLSPVKQDDVDDLLHASGYSPEPIAFDPQAGQPISIDRVQRASSILQRYIRSGRFEGPLLGEMKQVARVLRDAVTRASADAGAAADLDAARTSTITYQGAFGKELRKPTTTRANLEKQANPVAFREREEEARLARTRRYDPTLVDSYRQVKATREALKKFPSEDQLRKGLQQVPSATGPDLPRLRLQEPAPLPRASNLDLPPIIPEPKTVPVDLKPLRKISTGDIVAAKQAAAEASAGKWWRRGEWAAAVPIFQAMRAFWGGHIPSIAAMGLESAGVLATAKLANELLRYPPMIRFLTQARPEDIALIPPELRGDLSGLVSQARSQGITVAPALIAATAGQAKSTSSTPPPAFVTQAIQAMQPVFAGGTQ